eukprot:TRINITY_DN4547_c1_g2_i2.p1 TRINITY_DN4547_c1_g2~~TRINITY_DN4547_c1_g2_i2.p1  ORF type:complete len:293 (+),score=43.60 TRINITY_DN4547_c1_g2_i2:426-1304(+)
MEHGIGSLHIAERSAVFASGPRLEMALTIMPTEVTMYTNAGESTMASLPPEILQRIFQSLDFSSLLAAMCVNKEWQQAVSVAPACWSQLVVPKSVACRLWDNHFEALIGKAKGLTSLDVSWSGVSGNALLALGKAQVLAPVVDELSLRHCCNISGPELVAFIASLSPPSPLSGGPSSPPTSIIRHLAIEGCTLLTPGILHALFESGVVGSLDVGACVCSRVEVLEKCSLRECRGLCQHCGETYKGSGLACGSCSQPQTPHQALRVLVHRWILEKNTSELRMGWRDVRHGIEL